LAFKSYYKEYDHQIGNNDSTMVRCKMHGFLKTRQPFHSCKNLLFSTSEGSMRMMR